MSGGNLRGVIMSRGGGGGGNLSGVYNIYIYYIYSLRSFSYGIKYFYHGRIFLFGPFPFVALS